MTFKASSLKSGYRRNAGKRWRGDDLKRLRRLVNTGAPLGAISLQLGRPGSAIRAKAAEIGLRIEMDEPRTGGAPRRVAERPVRSPVPSFAAPASPASKARQLELFG